MEKILEYLTGKYDPESMILYGSYADGTNNLGSDFDALLLSGQGVQARDVSVVDGVQLDVFIYPANMDYQCEDFPQLYHCRILSDKHGKAAELCRSVRDYIDGYPGKSGEEIETDLAWCEKMLARTQRADAEGYYRWHWVLCDSLEFYCNICRRFYFGPKKTLRWMRREDPVGFAVYSDALSTFERDKLADWIHFLREKWEDAHEVSDDTKAA